MPTTETIAQLHTGPNMTEPLCSPLGKGEVAVFSIPCPTIDSRENEDSAAVLVVDASRRVLAVADGVGGMPGGQQASARALEVFVRVAARRFDSGGGMRESILDGLEAANKAVSDLGIGGATTIAIAGIKNDSVRCFHVGDSAVLVVGQRGRVKHMTVAHSPVGYAVESGMLDERDAMTHEERNIVSNVLGSDAMKIEIGPEIRLAVRDTVLLASDGVLDNVVVDEITDIVRVGRLRKSAAALAKLCHKRMTAPNDNSPSKPDDTTFLIYRPVRQG